MALTLRRPYENHGMTNKAEYGNWDNMRHRCYNPIRPEYKNYGGKGIIVCDRWRNSFSNFLNDMGPKPSPKHSINRIDSDGNYEPNNCEWALQSSQNINQHMRKDNTSGYRGVDYHKQRDKWRARVKWHNIVYQLGLYSTPEEAAYVRDQAALQIHGSNTTLNFNY